MKIVQMRLVNPENILNKSMPDKINSMVSNVKKTIKVFRILVYDRLIDCFICILVTSSVLGETAIHIPTENSTPATEYSVFNRLAGMYTPVKTAAIADAIKEMTRYVTNFFILIL